MNVRRRRFSAQGPEAARTIMGGASVRFGAEAMALLFSFGTGLVTARSLGPQGKGDLATMGYMMVLFVYVAALGLGEASITLHGRGRDLRELLSRVMGILSVSAVVSVAAYLAVTFGIIGRGSKGAHVALVITAAQLPVLTVLVVFVVFIEGRREFWASSLSRVSAQAVAFGATVVLVGVLQRGIAGAAIAALAGWVVGLVVVVAALRRLRLVSRPVRPGPDLRPLLRIGLPIQTSYLLWAATTRLDVVLVRSLRGSGDAGDYSVATTLGALSSFAALGLASAAYPRLAELRGTELRELTARATRLALLVPILIGIPLALVFPALVPRLFGPGFRGAVGPAVVLLTGGTLWSGQWMLTRAHAAVGQTSLLVQSFAANLMTMVVLDLVLIPSHGIMGAAFASVAGSAVGFGVALLRFGRSGNMREVLPRPSDLQEFATMVGRLRAARQVRSGRPLEPPP